MHEKTTLGVNSRTSKVLLMGDIEFSETEVQTFLRIIREMPANVVYGIIHQHNIDVPFELHLNELPEFLFDELEPDVRKEIIDNYVDAGKALCYFFSFDKPVPGLDQLLRKRSAAIVSLKREGIIENLPYFEKFEIHEPTKSLRVRFHYYKGRTHLFDKETQSLKEYLPVFPGVVIFRPGRKLVEVRAKYRSVSRNAVTNSSVALGLEAPYSLNLHMEVFIQRFLNWINSLNNARFEFDVRQVLSSLSMSARGRIDLRGVNEFRKYLTEGRLKGGHATIITEDKRKIKFRIFFRNCRVYFTSFSNEDDIEIIGEALEKIVEGYRFETPDKLLEDYFK